MDGLTKILESESIILVDGSIEGTYSAPDEKNFVWEIYDVKNYGQINKNLIEKKISEIESFAEILSCPNVYTLEEVVKEIKNFEEILNNKIKFLNDKMRLISSIVPSLHERTKEKIKMINKEPKELLKKLQEEVYKMRRLSESKEIHKFPEFRDITDAEYSSLLNMTKLISYEIKLKRDTAFLIGLHETDKSKESDTDERLVATLYRLSSLEKSSCLLSEDMDFKRLLGVVTRLICSNSFLPYNEEFREKLIKNQFKLYIKSIKEKRYKLGIQSSEIKYCEEFQIGGVTTKRSEEIKQKIDGMWKRMHAEKLQVNAIMRQYL